MSKKPKRTPGEAYAWREYGSFRSDSAQAAVKAYDAAIRKVAKARRDERAKCVDAANGVRNEYVGRYDKLPAVVACDDIITMLEKVP